MSSYAYSIKGKQEKYGSLINAETPYEQALAKRENLGKLKNLEALENSMENTFKAGLDKLDRRYRINRDSNRQEFRSAVDDEGPSNWAESYSSNQAEIKINTVALVAEMEALEADVKKEKANAAKLKQERDALARDNEELSAAHSAA
eukprot:515675-Pyramimonas_sp.AAC.1